jgi:hypothetical protein
MVWDWRLEEDGEVLDSSSAASAGVWSICSFRAPLLLLPAHYCWRHRPPMDEALIVFDQMGIKVYIVFFYPFSILLTHLYNCAVHIY